MVRDLPVIVVVGGGIAGLYGAYLLGRAGYPVTVLEQSDRWGGRIESVKLPPDSPTPFIAEFGPMRFEPGLQERLVLLARHLGIEFTPFAPTTAPQCPTDYELSDVEASFTKTSDLLCWAVMRMFFGDATVATDPVAQYDTVLSGPQQLAALRASLDRYLDADYDTVQARLDVLRETQRLGGSTDESAPLLRDTGFWNALAEMLTPGALAKIRDSGTFYHLIEHNPSAGEWGVFWLRQASTRGASIETFSAESAPDGIVTLIDRLVARIQKECPSVQLRLHQRVVAIEHAKQPGELELRVEDRTSGGSYDLRADHVVLALPQSALRRLSGVFPDEVRQDIERVQPLPLLKAFLVTNKPWWRHHVTAQSHAWLVPTRELHYYTLPQDPDCPREVALLRGESTDEDCTCPPAELGMVMLYTDDPAIDFWKPFVAETEQDDAHLYGPGDAADATGARLKRALVRQLLVEAHPDIAAKIDLERRRVEEALRDHLGDLGNYLIQEGRTNGLPLSTVLRHHIAARSIPEREQFETIFHDLFGQDDSWVTGLLDPIAPAKTKDELTDEYLESVVAYGIHDWSREPFGGAAHVWRPGMDSLAVRHRLAAFGLRGRGERLNVHVCGEAYSDFQGFIEGALRSTESACKAIAGPRLSVDLGLHDPFEEASTMH